MVPGASLDSALRASCAGLKSSAWQLAEAASRIAGGGFRHDVVDISDRATVLSRGGQDSGPDRVQSLVDLGRAQRDGMANVQVMKAVEELSEAIGELGGA